MNKKVVCLGCGLDMGDDYFPICCDCFLCPECGYPNPWGKTEPKRVCQICKQEIPGQKDRVINLHCDECGKTWKTEGSYLWRYKQRIKFVRKTIKDSALEFERKTKGYK